MPPALSLIITNSAYLSDRHLEFQIDALNRQTRRDFQVFYLNQMPQPDSLQRVLQRAFFPVRLVQLNYPWLAQTCCWDLVTVMGRLLEQPVHGPYLSYLHKECLPAPDFVAQLLEGIAATEAELGSECIYRLNQLHCPLEVEALEPLYPLQLAAAENRYWIRRTPFAPEYVFQERAWEEDAFALPVELARRTQLFSAVPFPLFFQDLFDIFYQLPHLPRFEQVHQVHLGQPVIYHLNHARPFQEYRQVFLQAVRAHPQLFGHLALYDLAAEDFDYREGFTQGERIISEQLKRFVHYMRYSDKGTVTLWRQALS